MNPPPSPVIDPGRLEGLRVGRLLDAATQESWDGLTAFASRLLRAPMACMTVVDEPSALWLSSVGLDGVTADLRAGVEQLVCRPVIATLAPFVVDDATQHLGTSRDMLHRLSGVRAWIGYPVVDQDDEALGSFCVMDIEARIWSSEDVELLGVLAQAASAQLSLLTAVANQRAAREALAMLRESESRAEERLQRLAFVALELAGAETIEDLTEIVINNGLPVVGADGGAVVVRADETVLRLAVSDRLGEHVQGAYGVLPVDDPLPASYVARTGERLVLPTRASGLAFTEEMGPLYEATERLAWVFTPLKIGNRLLGALAVSWVEERDFTDDELTVIDAFAAQCAQALDRIRIADAARESALKVQRLAEALQRSLLTQPPTPADLDIAFRYLPAVQEAQVGGDWYDAFDNASGATVLSVGDVAGHDRNAAAAMAQLRNLLRGMAVDSDDSPAVLLSRLDHAIARLGLDTLATALVARVEPGHVSRGGRGRRVRWSSAGHLPPLLRLPSGQVRVLADTPDLLLGLDPETDRVERITELPDGCTLLLYTDGLVERRGESIDVGLKRLASAFTAVGEAGVEQVCDLLLDAMVPNAAEDDVAMLVLRPPAATRRL